MAERIADDQYPKHGEAVAYFNRLIMDLKKQLLGGAYFEPITMERLNESRKHFNDLDQCREHLRKY